MRRISNTPVRKHAVGALALGLPFIVCAGCGDPAVGQTAKEVVASIRIEPDMLILDEGLLEFDSIIHVGNPTTRLGEGELEGFRFNGRAGGRISITQIGEQCGAPDTFLYLFGPEDENGDRGVDLIHNDDSFLTFPCFLDSWIGGFTLPADGEYLILASSFAEAGGGRYQLTLTCDNRACAPADAPTFAGTRIAQSEIDAGQFTADDLFEIGDFMFEINYRVQNGLGNGLLGSPAGNRRRPNFRVVHEGGFGGPDAQSCLTCHNLGGEDGAGRIERNIFQDGDGVNPASSLRRNPQHSLGLGYRQEIAREMTSELQAELAAAQAAAAETGTPQVAALGSKGVSFGSAIANPDGSVDFSGLQGIDTDLVVKPFGWKGRQARLRGFAEGALRAHFGMQSQPSVDRHCAVPDPSELGDGPDCQDPDGDGVRQEIVEGQLTALAVYLTLLEAPTFSLPEDPAQAGRVREGIGLFEQIGCNGCHRATMSVDDPVVTELPDSGGAGIALDLRQDTHEPRPPTDQNGTFQVLLWSDFKRHDMGPSLADPKPSSGIPASHFLTPPLWALSTTPPYLHDGRAPTVADAIAAHDGEARAARDAWLQLSADERSKVLEFLSRTGRAEESEEE